RELRCLNEKNNSVVHEIPVVPTFDKYDITHGAAGVGLGYLHGYNLTQNSDWLHSVKEVVSVLINSYTENQNGVFWESSLKKGKNENKFYGFAHGTAGI